MKRIILIGFGIVFCFDFAGILLNTDIIVEMPICCFLTDIASLNAYIDAILTYNYVN